MSIFTSFVAVGIICAIASIIYDMTKLTPGHITSLFVVLGAIMGVFGFYDLLIDKFGHGLATPITSFGNNLINAAYEGYHANGIFGLFNGMLTSTSAGITGAIVFGFIVSMFFKPKD